MLLTKEQVQNIDDFKFKIVDVPEWGGEVKVRSMSAKDRIAFEANQDKLKSQTEMVVFLVLYTCVDDDGNRLFEDKDIEMLEQKSPNALLKIFNASIDLNILSSDKVDEQAKNS